MPDKVILANVDGTGLGSSKSVCKLGGGLHFVAMASLHGYRKARQVQPDYGFLTARWKDFGTYHLTSRNSTMSNGQSAENIPARTSPGKTRPASLAEEPGQGRKVGYWN